MDGVWDKRKKTERRGRRNSDGKMSNKEKMTREEEHGRMLAAC